MCYIIIVSCVRSAKMNPHFYSVHRVATVLASHTYRDDI